MIIIINCQKRANSSLCERFLGVYKKEILRNSLKQEMSKDDGRNARERTHIHKLKLDEGKRIIIRVETPSIHNNTSHDVCGFTSDVASRCDAHFRIVFVYKTPLV